METRRLYQETACNILLFVCLGIFCFILSLTLFIPNPSRAAMTIEYWEGIKYFLPVVLTKWVSTTSAIVSILILMVITFKGLLKLNFMSFFQYKFKGKEIIVPACLIGISSGLFLLTIFFALTVIMTLLEYNIGFRKLTNYMNYFILLFLVPHGFLIWHVITSLLKNQSDAKKNNSRSLPYLELFLGVGMILFGGFLFIAIINFSYNFSYFPDFAIDFFPLAILFGLFQFLPPGKIIFFYLVTTIILSGAVSLFLEMMRLELEPKPCFAVRFFWKKAVTGLAVIFMAWLGFLFSLRSFYAPVNLVKELKLTYSKPIPMTILPLWDKAGAPISSPASSFFIGENKEKLRNAAKERNWLGIAVWALAVDASLANWELEEALETMFDTPLYDRVIFDSGILLPKVLERPGGDFAVKFFNKILSPEYVLGPELTLKLAAFFKARGDKERLSKIRHLSSQPGERKKIFGYYNESEVPDGRIYGQIFINGYPASGLKIALFNSSFSSYPLSHDARNLRWINLKEDPFSFSAPIYPHIQFLRKLYAVSVTDASGSFNIQNIRPGSYIFAIRIPGEYKEVKVDRTPGIISLEKKKMAQNLGTIRITTNN